MRFVVPLALIAGCYSPGYRDCEISCKVSQTCPDGKMCVADRCVGSASTTCPIVDGATNDAAIPSRVEVALVPVAMNFDLDILFVIDDSTSMPELSSNFRSKLGVFVTELGSIPLQGLPNIHLGVVTSDLGTKGSLDASAGPMIGNGAGQCSSGGKNGNLQTNGSTLVNGNFISDTKNTDGTRTLNYSGTLEGAFSAIANMGTSGCDIEQHIEAAKRALNNNPANAGFIRPNAGLGIFIIADEDDCSMAHSTLLGPDTSTLGPLQSFRCTRFGVTCDQGGATVDEMNMVGAKSSCHSNDNSLYFSALSSYTTFFSGLKPDPRTIMFGGIVGPTTPFSVELRTPLAGGAEIPALAHSCMPSPALRPDPAVRIAQLANNFPRASVESACTTDLTNAMLTFARHLRNFTGDPCLARDLQPTPDCLVFDTRIGSETELPACSGTILNDCYAFVPDSTRCRSGQHLRLDVRRSAVPPADTMVSVRCMP